MTTIAATSAVTAQATTTNTTSSSSSSTELTSTDFLSLLSTQLSNEDPLNPTDPNEFTSEMVEFGALSQQIDTNTKLDTISSTLSQMLTQVSLLAGDSSTSGASNASAAPATS